jgi:hypothetical protein
MFSMHSLATPRRSDGHHVDVLQVCPLARGEHLFNTAWTEVCEILSLASTRRGLNKPMLLLSRLRGPMATAPRSCRLTVPFSKEDELNNLQW